MSGGKVISLSLSSKHTFSKANQETVELITGLGIKGDAHMGKMVKHRSRVAKDPTQPNLRQVHLIHSELHQDLKQQGFQIMPGDMGENITTLGINLLDLPKDTILEIGKTARIQITGLRNPCHQLDKFQSGLMKAVLGRDTAGNLIRKAGIMGIVLKGGKISVGDSIKIYLPNPPFIKLDRV